MPSKQINNPLGQSGEAFDYGNDFIYVEYDPAVSASTVINSGNIVKVSPVAGLASNSAQLLCRLTTTTADFSFLGVAVDAPSGGYVPGQVVKIATTGKVNVLFDTTTTVALGLALQSGATAGIATYSATATLGKTLGIVLEAVTTPAAGTLIPVLLRFM
jgi:hypothetical protein